jgi:TRAF3-interacting protein 1
LSLVSLIEAITGTNLTVRPIKIVAGHEPSKTNELLQAIGKALDQKVSSVLLLTTGSNMK